MIRLAWVLPALPALAALLGASRADARPRGAAPRRSRWPGPRPATVLALPLAVQTAGRGGGRAETEIAARRRPAASR